jgi:hypothetical protein
MVGAADKTHGLCQSPHQGRIKGDVFHAQSIADAGVDASGRPLGSDRCDMAAIDSLPSKLARYFTCRMLSVTRE